MTPASAAPFSRLRQSFRRSLDHYHDQAGAQARIADDLAAMLLENRPAPRIGRVFEFGCGTGHLTRALLQRFEITELVLNDLVAEAATPACAIAAAKGLDAAFMAGPVEGTRPGGGWDLIASASTVQWIADLPRLLQRLCGLLRPGGWLALSGFGRDQFRELVALGSLAQAPNYLDLRDWPAVLPQGMELIAIRQAPIVLEFGSASEVLRHLRATGVNAGANRHWTRAALARFQAGYQARFAEGGVFPLTYDPVILVARQSFGADAQMRPARRVI